MLNTISHSELAQKIAEYLEECTIDTLVNTANAAFPGGNFRRNKDADFSSEEIKYSEDFSFSEKKLKSAIFEKNYCIFSFL